MNILVEDFKTYGQKVIDELNDYASKQAGWEIAPNNFEGIRVNLNNEKGDGWFLLRMSLHEPLMPLNIESNIECRINNSLQCVHFGISETSDVIGNCTLNICRDYKHNDQPIISVKVIEKPKDRRKK